MTIADAERKEKTEIRQEIALEEKKIYLIRVYVGRFIENLEAYLAASNTEGAESTKGSILNLLSIIKRDIDKVQLLELQNIIEQIETITLPGLRESKKFLTPEQRGQTSVDMLIAIKEADLNAAKILVRLIPQQVKMLSDFEKIVTNATKDTIDRIDSVWKALIGECAKEAVVISKIKDNEKSRVMEHLTEFLDALEKKLIAASH